MDEKKREELEEQDKVKKKKVKEKVPYCTTAPSAEHARGELEDDACDDYREGE